MNGNLNSTGLNLLTKVVNSFIRSLAAVDGSVSYTGVGFKPKAIHLIGGITGTTIQVRSFCSSDLTQYCKCNVDTGTMIGAAAIAKVQSEVGAYQVGTVTSFDDDGFTIAWVKTGSPTGNFGFNILAEG
jgi:hypothetical protein